MIFQQLNLLFILRRFKICHIDCDEIANLEGGVSPILCTCNEMRKGHQIIRFASIQTFLPFVVLQKNVPWSWGLI